MPAVSFREQFRQAANLSAVERSRYETLRQTMLELRPLFEGKTVLDYGASYGLSACALIELGAKKVVGVEPDADRVTRGVDIIHAMGLQAKVSLATMGYEAWLPFRDKSFQVVVANAVFEHIPQPRHAYLREVWRVLVPSGHLIINESPNKYFPHDAHTTRLWFVPWMPSDVARRWAIFRGRIAPDQDWRTSGWRGVGYYEIVGAFDEPYRLIPETSRLRHRFLTSLGLPASLMDPYPTWIFQKLKAPGGPDGHSRASVPCCRSPFEID